MIVVRVDRKRSTRNVVDRRRDRDVVFIYLNKLKQICLFSIHQIRVTLKFEGVIRDIILRN